MAVETPQAFYDCQEAMKDRYKDKYENQVKKSYRIIKLFAKTMDLDTKTAAFRLIRENMVLSPNQESYCILMSAVIEMQEGFLKDD